MKHEAILFDTSEKRLGIAKIRTLKQFVKVFNFFFGFSNQSEQGCPLNSRYSVATQ
jgi:hypothetical protein